MIFLSMLLDNSSLNAVKINVSSLKNKEDMIVGVP